MKELMSRNSHPLGQTAERLDAAGEAVGGSFISSFPPVAGRGMIGSMSDDYVHKMVFHACVIAMVSILIGLAEGADPTIACMGILLTSILWYVHRPNWLRRTDESAVDDDFDLRQQENRPIANQELDVRRK